MAGVIFARQISPKPIRVRAMRAALEAEQKRIGQAIKKDFESTVATWEHRPRFTYALSLVNGRSVLKVGLAGTGSEAETIYSWVNSGTRPHLIPAGVISGKSKKKSLRFPGTFRAKSAPNIIGAGPGGSGGGDVFARMVRHPGTKARRFDRAISKRWAKLHAARMRSAMSAARQASGHAI